jgi:archaellum component FlaG (FlaF/FlaG flagellin family)
MPITRTQLLDLPIIETDTESGTWGDAVNKGLTQYLDIAIAGVTQLTGSNFSGSPNYDLTLQLTTGDASATNIDYDTAQYSAIRVTSLNANSTIIAPASSRSYKVINADATYTLTIKATGQTGVTLNPGASATVVFNGTDYIGLGVQAASTLTSGTLIKGAGGNIVTLATAGTDYVAPGTATTFTALQTFSGTSANLAQALANSAEVVTTSASGVPSAVDYDITTQSVLFYQGNAGANWTVNFRASSGTTLNAALATGRSVTVVLLATQAATAYYNTAITIDGVSVVPKYQGGIAWTAGNASSIDAYVYTIIKTASATYTVLASQTQFK